MTSRTRRRRGAMDEPGRAGLFAPFGLATLGMYHLLTRRQCMFRLLGVLLFALLVAAPMNPIAAEDTKKDDTKEGWVQLFNGTDLKGWKVYPSGTGKWKVEKGVLIGSGEA